MGGLENVCEIFNKKSQKYSIFFLKVQLKELTAKFTINDKTFLDKKMFTEISDQKGRKNSLLWKLFFIHIMAWLERGDRICKYNSEKPNVLKRIITSANNCVALVRAFENHAEVHY